MPLHLIKLCVGCDSVADLEDWIKQKLKEKKRRGQKPEHIHTTRMVPKRAEELKDRGSLYWGIWGRATPRMVPKRAEELKDRARLSWSPRAHGRGPPPGPDTRPSRTADGIGRCRV